MKGGLWVVVVTLLCWTQERSVDAKKRGISQVRVANLTEGTLTPGKENLNFCYEILAFSCPVNLLRGVALQRGNFHPHFRAVVQSSA